MLDKFLKFIGWKCDHSWFSSLEGGAWILCENYRKFIGSTEVVVRCIHCKELKGKDDV